MSACFNADAIALKAINGLGSGGGGSAVVKLTWAGKSKIELNTQGSLSGVQVSGLGSFKLSKASVGGNFNKQASPQLSDQGAFKLKGGVNAGI